MPTASVCAGTGRKEAFSPLTVSTGSPAIGLLLCFTAFIGFEATTIYAEEI
jgi:amino acid transporter